MNEKLEKLNELHKASTQGIWGPTTRPPYNHANGQFAAEAHNLFQNMLLTIGTLSTTLLAAGVAKHFVDEIIDTCMEADL